MSSPSHTCILDSDGGCDDAVAFLHLLMAEDVDVTAVTAVFGNTDVHRATRNLQYVAREFTPAPRTPPVVFRGCAAPLCEVSPPAELWEGHGAEAMGSIRTSTMEDTLPAIPAEHAALAMLRLVNERPNEIDIIAIGPLTNVALAMKIDPSFVEKIKSCTIMGGTSQKGNSSRTAEFNIQCDPEAAHLVFKKFEDARRKLVVVDWDVCESFHFKWSDYDKLVATNTRAAAFIKEVNDTYEKFARKPEEYYTHHQEHEGEPPVYICADLYAVAAYLRPQIVTETLEMNAKIEVAGWHTRGTLCYDWYKKNAANEPANVVLVRSIDLDAFYQLFKECVHQENTGCRGPTPW